MNTKSTAVALCLVLAAACGGEAASSGPPTTGATATPVAATSAPATTDAPPPAVPSASAASSTAASTTPTPATTPPPPAGKADISGTVTTMPAKAIRGGAVVYLENAPKEAGVGMSATVDNIRMAFVPYLTVITAGGTVKFANKDPFPHNVFSPPPSGWNIGNLAPHAVKERTFAQPGTHTLLCNLHPNMIGYIVVSPSSYFVKTDHKGHYVLKDVPAGTYKISAWAPRLKTTTQSVTVAGSPVTVDLAVRR